MVVSAERQMKVDACESYIKFMLLDCMLCLSFAVVVLSKELILCLLFHILYKLTVMQAAKFLQAKLKVA